ncbi:tRNA dimethylallyltransferase [alpha proteobacterium AAP81b]|nr:tRNA dimethylallyltransferase [alpha proteobacterium AAP81b]
MKRDMVVVIAGPTASGKSALAIDLAERHRGTIINADASQLYADLRILTARPTPEDEARVPHRLYGVLDGAEVATAAGWADLARVAIAATLGNGRLPIVVGGTGLYLRTLIDGIAPVPEIPPEIRDTVRLLAPADAAAALAREDPAAAARLNPGDRQRIARALEVVRATGRPLAAWQAEPAGGIAATHDVRALRVDLPRAELNARAETRLAAMVAAGALDEVAALLARRLPADRPVLRALGVPEFAAVLAGEMALAEGVAAAALATRRYQKRQATWARNQTGDWPVVTPGDVAGITALIGAP